MKISKLCLNVCIGILLAVLFTACSKQSEGACVRWSGISSSCGDGFTSGKCDMMNGKFYEGKSCSDLGFRSS